jgi:hypothetical protein
MVCSQRTTGPGLSALAPVFLRLALDSGRLRVFALDPIVRPARAVRRALRFDTMPSTPRAQACRKTIGPSASTLVGEVQPVPDGVKQAREPRAAGLKR